MCFENTICCSRVVAKDLLSCEYEWAEYLELKETIWYIWQNNIPVR